VNFKSIFLETSAKNAINVENAFFALAKQVKKRLIDSAEPPPDETGIKLKKDERGGGLTAGKCFNCG